MSDKAQRAEIQIGPHMVEGFMLPDGSYRMSLTQTADIVGKPARGTFDFLKSKGFKRLLQEAGGTFDFLGDEAITAISADSYTADQFQVDIGDGSQGQTRIRGIPLEIAALYWQWESHRGNKQAFLLVSGLITETLERRFDTAFGVSRSESEYNQRLIDRNAELERALQYVSAGMEMEDEILRRLDFYERWFQDRGIDPYALPSGEGGDL